MKKTCLFVVLAMIVSVGVAEGAVWVGSKSVDLEGKKYWLSASVEFTKMTLDGGSTGLKVVLTNTAGQEAVPPSLITDVMIPSQLLTAIFFDITGDPTLTPVSAIVPSASSTVYFDTEAPFPAPVAGGLDVGGEWAIKKGNLLVNVMDWPTNPLYGISSSGFGIFAPPNQDGTVYFGSPSLDNPIEVDGPNYGITAFGDNTATGNAKVTGGVPLIKYQVEFTLTGIPDDLDVGSQIQAVRFQYGTSLDQPFLIPGQSLGIPEPASLVVWGLLTGGGLVALRCRRRFKGREAA